MLKANISNTWKNIKYGYVNVNNVWKKMKNIYTNINGVWKPLWSYSWYTGNWSSCSAECGGGTQTRTVYCKRNDNVQVDDAFCSGTKPSTQQSCNTQSCEECAYDPVFVEDPDGGISFGYLWRYEYYYNLSNPIYINIYWNYAITGTSYEDVNFFNRSGYQYTKGEEKERKSSSSFLIIHYEICRKPI